MLIGTLRSKGSTILSHEHGTRTASTQVLSGKLDSYLWPAQLQEDMDLAFASKDEFQKSTKVLWKQPSELVAPPTLDWT